MKFEDLEVWKRAARLSAHIYKATKDQKDFGFRDQITRAALSIPSNIAERFERGTHKECLRFLHYAKGSCGELRTQIFVGMDIDYIHRRTGNKWVHETQELSLMLGGLIRTKRGFLK